MKIFPNKLATVIGPTHPGTGLIAYTLSITFSKSTSPVDFQFKNPYQTSIII